MSGGVDRNGKWGRLDLPCSFEKGPVVLSVTFRKSGEEWLVVAEHYDSPALLAPRVPSATNSAN